MKAFNGTVTIYKDRSYNGTKYSLSGEFDFVTSGNKTLKGGFWKKDAEW